MLHQLISAAIKHARICALLLCGLSVAAQAQVDAMRDAALEGQDFAHTLLEQAPEPGYSPGGEREQGTVHLGEQAIPVNQLQPGGDRAEQDRLQTLQGNTEGLLEAGGQYLNHIAEDSSAAAQSLRVVTSTPRTSPQQVWASEQNVLAQSALALSSPASIAPDFPACTAHTVVSPATQTYQRPHTRICERVHRPEHCLRTQQLSDASQDNWQAVHEAVRLDGSLTRHYALRERLPADIQPVAMAVQASGDHSAVAIRVIEPPSLSNDWTASVQLEPTDSACAAGCVVNLELRIALRALKQITATEPPNCLLDQDAFCRADFQCEQSHIPSLAGAPLQAAEALALPPLYAIDIRHLPADPRWPVCTRARARYHCQVQSGSFCIEGSGGRHCIEQSDDQVLADTCAPLLQSEPQCQLQATQCTEGATAASDWCYVESLTYQCPETLVAPTATVLTTQPCASQIRCAGHDCLDTRDQESSLADLADGMAGMMLVQAFASDWQTIQAKDHAGSGTVGRVFPGRAFECRKALGGTISCCDETHTDVESEWFARYQRHIRRSQAKASQQHYAEQGEHGSWKTLAEQDQHRLQDLSKALTSGPETISAGIDSELDPDPGSSVGNGHGLREMNQEFIEAKREDYLDDTGYACSVPELDLAIQRELGHCLPVGSYCQQGALGACLDKRDVYCCFNSPASAEIRASVARDAAPGSQPFGTARNPNCAGLLIEDARPQSVALSTLKARLAAGGVLPDAGNLLARSSAERLTGSGSQLADGHRPTTQQRSAARMAAIDGAKVREDLHLEVSAQVPALPASNTAGQLAFAPAYLQVARGRPIWLSVVREGRAGPVSVSLSVRQVVDADGQVLPTTIVALNANRLFWPDREEGLQRVRVNVPADFVGRIELALQQPTGGAVCYPNDRAELHVLP